MFIIIKEHIRLIDVFLQEVYQNLSTQAILVSRFFVGFGLFMRFFDDKKHKEYHQTYPLNVSVP